MTLHARGLPVMHGGDLAAASARFPDVPQPWVDLSTGINPHNYPIPAIPDASWQRLPDRAALRVLEHTAARRYEVPSHADIVAAPGTQALIQLLPRIFPARRVAILGYGYGEHPSVWQAAGADVQVVTTLGDLAEAEVAVVVNPNNPDGRLCSASDLAEVARHLVSRGGALVVDEAFMDVVEPGQSLVPSLPTTGVLVLRSFGKFYGLGGLRLGFAVAEPETATCLRAALGSWPVSGPAISIGAQALADNAWRARAVTELRGSANRLDSLLLESGLTVHGGTSLFRLAVTPHAASIHDRLGRAGILVRPFPERPTWLRFGLPGDEPAWHRLREALGP